jgi:uncharacterized protein
MTPDPSETERRISPGGSGTPSAFDRHDRGIFFGPERIRVGWRLLIAFAIFLALLTTLESAVRRIPGIHAWLHSGQQAGAFTPRLILFSEGISVLCLLISAWFMALIEKRSFTDYGLPVNEMFGRRFWQGVPYGLAMLTLLMSFISAFRGFSLGGFVLRPAEVWRYGLLYLLAFVLVALFEEFAFRGYLQATLASGIGFWPAAILLAVFFGALHLRNSGEAVWGALMAGAFGLLAAFSLFRTGNLWFAVGVHASWDWGETYLYSVPDSGQLAQGHLLNSSFHGPNWLTGGSVGPEGSAFVFVVLLFAAVGIHFMFPPKQQPL